MPALGTVKSSRLIPAAEGDHNSPQETAAAGKFSRKDVSKGVIPEGEMKRSKGFSS